MPDATHNPREASAIGDAFVGAQHAIMDDGAWAFLPMVMVNLVFITSVAIDKAPWWLVFPVPVAIICYCGFQLRKVHRNAARKLTKDEKRASLKSKGIQSMLMSAVMAGWGLALCVQAPQLTYFIAAVTGFTAIGCVTYVAYLETPMRVVLVVAGLAMLIIVLANRDYAGFVIAFCFAANALLLEVYISTHFSTFSSIVSQQFEAQAKYQDAKRAQAEIIRIANTDHLTGVMNRRGFLNAVECLVSERQEAQTPFALGVVDLDGFKPVNDCFGHAAGDQVLIEVAKRLNDKIAGRGHVARLGGDEFALLILDPGTPAELLELGTASIQALSLPVSVNCGLAQVSASCGFAIYPDAGTSAATLLEHADEALYILKESRRSTSAIYDVRSLEQKVRLARIEQKLRRAIDDGEITLHYQEIRAAGSHKLLAFEALARWRDETGEFISPAEFIPLAEQCGLIHHLSGRLLREALATACNWPADVYLSFNLSGKQLTDVSFGLQIVSMLNATGFSPSRLVLEITETAFLSNPEQARLTLEALRAIGVRVAIDDFGTGYSNFGHLDTYPVDVLKLDRQFLAGIESDTRRQAIVAAVVSMCRSLKLLCVAEGIETAAQLEAAEALGIDVLQGYYFAKPKPADELFGGLQPPLQLAV